MLVVLLYEGTVIGDAAPFVIFAAVLVQLAWASPNASYALTVARSGPAEMSARRRLYGRRSALRGQGPGAGRLAAVRPGGDA
jgi:hypothetical protein